MVSSLSSLLQNHNSNGYYCKLPDGTLIQWGKNTMSSWVENLTFPVEFAADKLISVCVTAQYNATNPWSMWNNITTTGFQVVTNNFPDGGHTVSWMAIGSWK